jgi:flagellar basal body P-ring formation protein FlgA
MSESRLISRLLHVFTVAVVCLPGVLPAHAEGDQVPVPRVTIYPGTVIEKGMLDERAIQPSSGHRASAVSSSDALVGKVARQTLLPGHPITTGSIREPYVVTRGNAALIMFRSGALTITANGLALQSGGAGEEVSVRNGDSGRIVKGTIGPDGAVHVGDP